MKYLPLLLFTFVLGASQNSNAQFLSNENAKKLKKSKVIIGTTADSTTNAWLVEAVESTWTLTEISEILPLEEALQKKMTGGNITVIQLGVDVTHRTTHSNGWEIETESQGGYIGLNTKGYPEADLMQHLSYNSKAQFVFGISSLQDAVSTIIDDNLKGMSKVRGSYNSRTLDTKNTTLYVCDAFIKEGIEVEDIKASYGGDVELVSPEEFENVILEKKENCAYLNFVTVPVGDQTRSVAYLLDSDNQQTFKIFLNGKVNVFTKKTLKNLE